MGETRVIYRILVGKMEGQRPLGRQSRRWEDNIKIGVQEKESMDWTGLAKVP
jgi:hypothetical protein